MHSTAAVLLCPVQADSSRTLPCTLAKLRRVRSLPAAARGSWMVPSAVVRALGHLRRSCRVSLASGAVTVDRVLKTAFSFFSIHLARPSSCLACCDRFLWVCVDSGACAVSQAFAVGGATGGKGPRESGSVHAARWGQWGFMISCNRLPAFDSLRLTKSEIIRTRLA